MPDLRESATGNRPEPATTATLTIRYFAGARAAAGRAEEHTPAGRSLDEVLADIADRHGERLRAVLRAASFLVDGVAWHDRQAPLPAGATIDILPPFAGG